MTTALAKARPQTALGSLTGGYELWFCPQIIRPPMDYPVELSQWKELSEATQRIIFVSLRDRLFEA